MNDLEDFLRMRVDIVLTQKTALKRMNNPRSSDEERWKACRRMLGNNPAFWRQIANLVAPRQKHQLRARRKETDESGPSNTKSRMPGQPPSVKLKTEIAVLPAEKRKPASEIQKEEPTIPSGTIPVIIPALPPSLSNFRQLMIEGKSGNPDYWNDCRRTLAVALHNRSLDPTDWTLLITRMKTNPFIKNRQDIQLFLGQCPRNDLAELLMGEGGLSHMIDKIQEAQNFSQAYLDLVDFVWKCCEALGEQGAPLIGKCADTVLWMAGTRHWIKSYHSLVVKANGTKRAVGVTKVPPTSPSKIVAA